MLLKAGSACWRVENAERLALIMDMQEYFGAAKAAMLNARRSIHLLNWAFDPDTFFLPNPGGSQAPQERFGPFLRHLAETRPGLDVRILCWRSALPVAATQNFFPHRAKRCFAGSPVKFRLDGSLPLGACHHQKMLIVDDALAFCGGGDIGPDRWDTPLHLDDDPRRQKTASRCYESRHETMACVDGDAARALGALFRLRWVRSSGESLPAPDEGDVARDDPWPECLEVAARKVRIGLSRTEPLWRNYPETREAETLHLAAIGAARRCIYMENQYFASPVMAEALAARLSEPDGPEVFLVSTQHSPSWFDRMTMDRTRNLFLRRLREADRFGRFGAYFPKTAAGRYVIVHSKLAVIDDELVRIGSANLNNRSTGFDTECDLSAEADPGSAGAELRGAAAAFRARLLSHWLGRTAEETEAARAGLGSLHAVVKAFDPDGDRLKPFALEPLTPFQSFIAAHHLGDPAGPTDSWRPWLRRSELRRQLRELAARLEAEGDPAPVSDLSPETV